MSTANPNSKSEWKPSTPDAMLRRFQLLATCAIIASIIGVAVFSATEPEAMPWAVTTVLLVALVILLSIIPLVFHLLFKKSYEHREDVEQPRITQSRYIASQNYDTWQKMKFMQKQMKRLNLESPGDNKALKYIRIAAELDSPARETFTSVHAALLREDQELGTARTAAKETVLQIQKFSRSIREIHTYLRILKDETVTALTVENLKSYLGHDLIAAGEKLEDYPQCQEFLTALRELGILHYLE